MDRRAAFLGLVLTLAGCGSCGSDDPSGYARCYASDPSWTGVRRVGGVEVEIEDRVATLRGASLPFRIGVLRGPAPHAGDLGPAVRALSARRPGALVVLGDLGDEEAAADASLAALATFAGPVFVLAGGRDEAGVLDTAFGGIDDDSSVIDARGLRVLRVGHASFLLLSGAPGPRYARNEKACAFDDDALEALSETRGGLDARATLFAWAAPRSAVAAQGIAGEPAGDPRLAAWLTENTQVDSAVFAWPTGAPFRATSGDSVLTVGEVRTGLRMGVGPAAGPGRLGDDDTAILPAVALLEARETGVALVEVLSVPVAPTTP